MGSGTHRLQIEILHLSTFGWSFGSRHLAFRLTLLHWRNAFADNMWQLPDGASQLLCKLCMRGKREVGLWTCFAADCKTQLPNEDFVLAHAKYTAQQLKTAKYHLCDRCLTLRQAEENNINADNIRHIMKHRRTEWNSVQFSRTCGTQSFQTPSKSPISVVSLVAGWSGA